LEVFRRYAPAHFHAIYGEFEATVNIVTGQLNGELPKRALAHVQEWRLLHQNELLEAWALAQAQQSLPKIDPLE
jgi:hypothetical protein